MSNVLLLVCVFFIVTERFLCENYANVSQFEFEHVTQY